VAALVAALSMALAAPALAASPPVIEREAVTQITQSDATLEATINDEGSEHGAWYQFQLVGSPSEYKAEFVCPPEKPEPTCIGPKESSPEALPISPLPRATGGQAVSQDVVSAGRTLSPGSTYHFRVIAANRVQTIDTIQWEPPIVYGADQMFTTLPSGPAQPTVTRVEPNQGSAAGGTSVTITGTNLTGSTAVKFGSTNATSFTVNSETSITAVAPAGTGTVDVTVTTPSGGTSGTSEADRFTYGPSVAKVEPNHGSPGGGTTVMITGTGFSGASAVRFGSSAAKSFTVNSATSITAVSPKGKGTVDVTVTTSVGTSPASAADQFTFSRK
jgi:hypothetical protein